MEVHALTVNTGGFNAEEIKAPEAAGTETGGRLVSDHRRRAALLRQVHPLSRYGNATQQHLPSFRERRASSRHWK